MPVAAASLRQATAKTWRSRHHQLCQHCLFMPSEGIKGTCSVPHLEAARAAALTQLRGVRSECYHGEVEQCKKH